MSARGVMVSVLGFVLSLPVLLALKGALAVPPRDTPVQTVPTTAQATVQTTAETAPPQTFPTEEILTSLPQETVDTRITGETMPGEPTDFVGRWKIPAVNIDVACYGNNAQVTVDNVDSAAYYVNSGHQVIADHNYQGFSAIGSCKPGTLAYLEKRDGQVVSYYCVAVIKGHNTEDALTDESYVSIDKLYPGTLVNYTCNENWQNVTIAFFQPE